MYLIFIQILIFYCIIINGFGLFTSSPCYGLQSHFSTKTPYRVIQNLDDKLVIYPGCTPLRIWSVIRHGTRNPSKKVILQARKQLHKIREQILSSNKNKLCAQKLARFREWTFKVDPENEKLLVYEGERELIELAERMQNRFPTLLPDYYDKNFYKFKYTATQRTRLSAESYAVGLFGRYNSDDVCYLNPLHKDPILRFYKLCNAWRINVDKSHRALNESRAFLKSDLMIDVVKNIRKLTGVNDLKTDDIILMYTICGFETSWSKQRTSVWCSLFDMNSIKVPEFYRDLEYYWIDGYGYELTYKQACTAFVDMIYHVSPDSHYPNATLYFTHSGTIIKLLSHLGLYKDDFIITHQDFNKKRLFKTSKIDAFASNLAFISYRCDEKDKLLVLHQERVVRLPGCPKNQDLCDLSTIRELYQNSIENCDFDKLCQIP